MKITQQTTTEATRQSQTTGQLIKPRMSTWALDGSADGDQVKAEYRTKAMKPAMKIANPNNVPFMIHMMAYFENHTKASVSAFGRRTETQPVRIRICVEKEVPYQDASEQPAVACAVYCLQQKCSDGTFDAPIVICTSCKGSLERPIVPKCLQDFSAAATPQV